MEIMANNHSAGNQLPENSNETRVCGQAKSDTENLHKRKAAKFPKRKKWDIIPSDPICVVLAQLKYGGCLNEYSKIDFETIIQA